MPANPRPRARAPNKQGGKPAGQDTRSYKVYLWKTNLKANNCRNSTFQVNTRKNATWKRRLTSRISIYCCCVLWSMDCLQLPFIRLEEAVLWTQRFLTRKIWPSNEFYLWQTNLKANVCRNSTFQVNTRKNATWKRRLTSRNRIAIFVSTSCEEQHNKPFRL